MPVRSSLAGQIGALQFDCVSKCWIQAKCERNDERRCDSNSRHCTDEVSKDPNRWNDPESRHEKVAPHGYGSGLKFLLLWHASWLEAGLF